MEETPPGWEWPRIFPRKLILAAWFAFHLIVVVAFLVQIGQSPRDPYWLSFWKSIGGNSSGVWYWFVSWAYLNSEVLTMILTLMSNKARVKKAVDEAVAKAVDEAVAKAVAEAIPKAVDEAQARAAEEQYRTWSEWNSRREEAAAMGQDFKEPPPEPPSGYHPNGNGRNSRE